MIVAINLLSELVYFSLPFVGLFVIFLIGYYLAWIDFRPKKATNNESISIQYAPSMNTDLEFSKPNKHEFTDAELGLHDLDSMGGLSDSQQRKLKLSELTREFGATCPESTAEIIRNWLSSH